MRTGTEHEECPECGNGEFWLLPDGRVVCAEYFTDCGYVRGTWQPTGTAALLSNRPTEER